MSVSHYAAQRVRNGAGIAPLLIIVLQAERGREQPPVALHWCQCRLPLPPYDNPDRVAMKHVGTILDRNNVGFVNWLPVYIPLVPWLSASAGR